MRQKLQRHSIHIIFPFITILFASCITSNKDEEQRRLALYFLAQNVGNEIVIDDQILLVDEFKFAMDRLNIYAENDFVLQTSGDVTALIYSYNKNIIDDRLVLDVDLGYREIDRFLGYEIFIEPVRDRTGVLDGDFFGSDGNYSVIIKGKVNEIEFTFRSSMEFEQKYEFSVDLNKEKETLLIRNIINVANVFTSSEGGFLDPLEPESEEQIFDNIGKSLEIQASAATIFELP